MVREVEVRGDANDEVELVLEREGGDAADEEASDDDREPDADGALEAKEAGMSCWIQVVACGEGRHLCGSC